MKIVVADGQTVNPGDLSWQGFEAFGTVTVYDHTPRELLVERVGSADILLVNKTPVKRELLEACPQLRYVGVLATGYNAIDLEAATEKGVVVTNIPTYGTMAVAQFTFALLLEICHHVAAHSQAVHSGRRTAESDWCFWDYPLIELAGKTMGCIGFGRIGQQTAAIARAMGMHVLAYDEHPTETGRALAEYVPLHTLLQRSDIVSLHCPLLPATRGIINRDSIAKMKDGVILLNTARGPLVVEQDLADALESGKVYAAGLDVLAHEPARPDNPLLRAKNCFITPHIAWASRESRSRLMNTAVENLRAFLQGTPVNVVNGVQ